MSSETPFVSILALPSHQLTPGMRQYQDVKRQHPDCLVMLRMGDFYEMFYEDAVAASRELEITLTSRGVGEKKAPLAGVPFHALENYLGRLVKKGYKVAIVEQLEDPKLAKGLVKRGLVRIVTPGTVMESSLLDEKENNYIVALTSFQSFSQSSFKNDSQKKNTSPPPSLFFLAACDISTGEFFVEKFHSEHLLFSELARLQPSECIIPESLKVNAELLHKLQNNVGFLQPREDFFFGEKKAEETLLQHFPVFTLDSFGLTEKENICVTGALLQYLLETQKNSLTHLNTVKVKSNQQQMIIDAATLKNLELLKNARDGSLRVTLLSVIDKTLTSGGGRLLKKWITEPLCNIAAIESRLDAVAQLHKQLMLREELRSVLKNIADLERLLSRINYGNATPRDVLALRQSLLQIPLLKNLLEEKNKINNKENKINNKEENNSSSPRKILQSISDMPEFSELVEELQKALKDDLPISTREGGLIKQGYFPELDQLYSLSGNSKKYLQQLEEKEREKTRITTLKIGYTNIFGYFIEVTKKNLSLVPAHYIRKQTTANSERYVTEELKIEEEKILTAQEKIVTIEYDLFQQLLKKITAQTTHIQESAQKVAVLDVLCSLATIAWENGYCRPEFVSEPVLQILAGRHPVVEKGVVEREKEVVEEEKKRLRFIANDLFLNDGEMMIITGPNMSGKSTVMRQTALIVLLAHMGSFVPAEKTVLGIVDRIFTRVGASDDVSAGQSTFMAEMQETAAILHNTTERSLIIIDEIGRGTSTFDGVSLAWSVAEHIHNILKAKTLFATHYHVLNKLAEKFSRVKNYNVAAKEVNGEVVLLHKLVPGGTDQSFGIHVAKLAGLPTTVVERAKELQEMLVKDDEMMRKLKVRKLEEQKNLEEF